MLRVFAGDAIAFSHALQNRRITKDSDSAHWYRDRHHFEPLTLDGEDYGSDQSAPLTFAVIDTSNLADHVGPLNLLVATSPLLQDDISASLHTEALVKRAKPHQELSDNLLCGHLPTVAVLLGLVPVEYWTNNSPLSAGDELLPTFATRFVGDTSEGGQMFVRFTWKRPITQGEGISSPASVQSVCFSESGIAQALYQIYLKMFEGEDLSHIFSDISQLGIRNLSLRFYHRASYASLLRLVKDRVAVDWDKAMDNLLTLIESNRSLSMGRHYVQELYLYMHLLGVHSVGTLRKSYNLGTIATFTEDLRDWREAPPALCVTLKVPRTELAVFTSDEPTEVGSPHIHCIVQSSPTFANGAWHNIFAAVQIGFGQLSTRGARHSNTYTVHIAEEPRGWHGTTPLFVSFMAPTWMLLLEPRNAKIVFGIQGTPQNAEKFTERLGLGLNVYETTLGDTEHVYVSKDMPNQTGFISVQGFAAENNGASSPRNVGVKTLIIADVDAPMSMRARGRSRRLRVALVFILMISSRL